MNQQKIGSFLKELRKEKGLTQEQLSEVVNVSNRTVSRWETGNNLPDLSVLIELAEFYDVDIRELIDGERKSENMDREVKETVSKVADYSEEVCRQLMMKLHVFSIIGVVTFIVFLVLEASGLANNGMIQNLASFCCGITFSVVVIALIYTSRYIYKLNAIKRKQFRRNELD